VMTLVLGETKSGLTCASEYTIFNGKKYYKITGDDIGTGGAEGQGADAGGGEEAVPEFTLITAIIAAVAGFGIFFVIRQKKQKAVVK